MSQTTQHKILILACTCMMGLNTFFFSKLYSSYEKTVDKVEAHDLVLQKHSDNIATLQADFSMHEDRDEARFETKCTKPE